jgi:hypothetical protein
LQTSFATCYHEDRHRDLTARCKNDDTPKQHGKTPGTVPKRLFHSMRASRQTELQREFPLHVVCSWLGNSPRIAQQSYLLVTEDDFARAAGVAKVMV